MCGNGGDNDGGDRMEKVYSQDSISSGGGAAQVCRGDRCVG